uniref:Uncharacterized protein n=1 Tax=Cannabis sativa TaxID=3483 RepID=A0A803NSX3_CANSA
MDVDLESMFKNPPKADKRSRRKVAQADEVSDSTKEPKRTKTKANMRKSSNQLTIDVDKSLEEGNEVSTVGIEVSAAGIIEKQPTRSAHQVDHDQKLKELEAGFEERVNNIGRRTIYQIWSANPELDFSFLGDKAETMLAYCEKTWKEDLGEEEEFEAEQENLTKSPIIM